MKHCSMWLKIRNADGSIERVLKVIRERDFGVTNMSLRRSLDHASYYVNLEIEGDRPFEGLSERLGSSCDVSSVQLDPTTLTAQYSQAGR